MKNIAIILSGGVGKRFGREIPKQYLEIDDKPCIDYVIEAVMNSKNIDKIVIAMDKKYIKLSNILNDSDSNAIDIVPNGKDRYDSIENAFEHIHKMYMSCESIIILDAVAPLVYPELIDKYIDLLKENDCVITAKNITGELGMFSDNDKILNRHNYYIMHSPEAYRYKKIYDMFDPKFESSELACQLPPKSKKFLYFDFPENIKITYPHELEFCKILIQGKNKKIRL